MNDRPASGGPGLPRPIPGPVGSNSAAKRGTERKARDARRIRYLPHMRTDGLVVALIAMSGVTGCGISGAGGEHYEPISGSVVLTPQCPTPDLSDWATAPIADEPAFTDAVDLDNKRTMESYGLLAEVAAVHASGSDCRSPIVLKSVGPARASAVVLAGVTARPRREADCKGPLKQPERVTWPLRPPRHGQMTPSCFCVYSTSARDYSVTARLDQQQRVHLDFVELTRGKFVIK